MSSHCNHAVLSFDSSSHVSNTKYKRIDEDRRSAATQSSGRVAERSNGFPILPATFPAPLVMPGDELALDGRYPAQSVRSWVRGEFRNKVTPDRKTIYVIPPPEINHDVGFMQAWSGPQTSEANQSRTKKSKQSKRTRRGLSHPAVGDIVEYFKAFFYGMDVRTLPEPWRFTEWTTSKRPQRRDQRDAVALETSISAVRIRTRTSPDGCYERQLNLSDLLDACVESVPEDAYALLLLVEQDMFEGEDDDFCCGQAFGGSRVAVVSTARYNPSLDNVQGIEREHSWPASHCVAYMEEICYQNGDSEDQPRQALATTKSDNARPARSFSNNSAIQAAVLAHAALQPLNRNPTVEVLEGLWLGRVCKTAAHEVGHCLGMDHCVYYACLMQGTANVGEDSRQPPFLCPVDHAKYTTATKANLIAQYEAILDFCDARLHIHLFAAFAAWLQIRLEELRSYSHR
jgi:archaemetzincin